MNKVILIGRLTAEPEIRHTNSGKTVASYRLAVDRNVKSEGQPEADFINCTAWGKTGEFAEKYLRKGMKIAIEGRIQTGSYEKDGVKHYTTDIIVDRHEFCESKRSADSGGYAEPAQNFTEIDDDGSDLPF
jgi:single-strand DNA-binding protein